MKAVVLLVAGLACVAVPAVAGKKFDRAKSADDAWEACVVSEAGRVAGRADAATAAEAAFAPCDGYEAIFRQALAHWAGPVGSAGVQRQMDQERQRIRARALSAILTH